MNEPLITFCANGENNVECTIDRCDGYCAKASGNSFAQALLRAALIYFNRQCQEFNRIEHDKQDADKHNYSKNPEERYRAKRAETMSLIPVGILLDTCVFANQAKFSAESITRAYNDINGVIEFFRDTIDGIPFMAEKGCAK